MFLPIYFSIFVLLLTTVGVCVYFFIYTLWVNRKIRSGKMAGRKLASVPKVIVVAFIIALLLICMVLLRMQGNREVVTDADARNSCVVIDASKEGEYCYIAYPGHYESDDASYAEIYSMEQNAGYEKEVTVDGAYRYTVFTRTEDANNFHPDFLCFAEYIGKDTDDLALYSSIEYFDYTREDTKSAHESGGGEICSKMLFIGNLGEGSDVRIVLSLLDEEAEQNFFQAESQAYEEDKGEFPKAADYAKISSQMVISVGVGEK